MAWPPAPVRRPGAPRSPGPVRSPPFPDRLALHGAPPPQRRRTRSARARAAPPACGTARDSATCRRSDPTAGSPPARGRRRRAHPLPALCARDERGRSRAGDRRRENRHARRPRRATPLRKRGSPDGTPRPTLQRPDHARREADSALGGATRTSVAHLLRRSRGPARIAAERSTSDPRTDPARRGSRERPRGAAPAAAAACRGVRRPEVPPLAASSAPRRAPGWRRGDRARPANPRASVRAGQLARLALPATAGAAGNKRRRTGDRSALRPQPPAALRQRGAGVPLRLLGPRGLAGRAVGAGNRPAEPGLRGRQSLLGSGRWMESAARRPSPPVSRDAPRRVPRSRRRRPRSLRRRRTRQSSRPTSAAVLPAGSPDGSSATAGCPPAARRASRRRCLARARRSRSTETPLAPRSVTTVPVGNPWPLDQPVDALFVAEGAVEATAPRAHPFGTLNEALQAPGSYIALGVGSFARPLGLIPNEQRPSPEPAPRGAADQRQRGPADRVRRAPPPPPLSPDR